MTVAEKIIYQGRTYGRARIGAGRRVHFVAQTWLDLVESGYRVTAACGRKGYVTEINPESEPCQDCSYIRA